MRLTTIINCDTRSGWLADRTIIGEHGSANLCGCRSVDFMTDATAARNRFLDSPLITERRTVLCIDVHEPIPDDIHRQLDALLVSGEITKIVEAPHVKTHKHWNDLIYCRSLAHAGDTDLVAHWDGDCIGYRREGFDVLAAMVDRLDHGASYVCQQSPLTKAEHGMEHASTRFFLTRRATLDLPEAERLLDARYKASKYPGKHLACLEHILGEECGRTVVYPPSDYESYVVFSWVHYYLGVIEKLNSRDYISVCDYVFNQCGGPLGASDLIGKPL